MLPYEKQKPKTPQPYGLMSTVADLKIGMLNAWYLIKGSQRSSFWEEL